MKISKTLSLSFYLIVVIIGLVYIVYPRSNKKNLKYRYTVAYYSKRSGLKYHVFTYKIYGKGQEVIDTEKRDGWYKENHYYIVAFPTDTNYTSDDYLEDYVIPDTVQCPVIPDYGWENIPNEFALYYDKRIRF